MGDWVEKAPRADVAQGAEPRGVERPPSSFGGRPTTYVADQLSEQDRWQALGQPMRDWTVETIGEALPNPVDGAARRYRRTALWVDADEFGSTATYHLVAFGRTGLAIARGTTRNFGSGGDLKWRSERLRFMIDTTDVRTNTWFAPASATGGNLTGNSGMTGTPFVPEAFSESFGNLPEETQRFVLAPWVRRGSRPQPNGCMLLPSCGLEGGEYVERYVGAAASASRLACFYGKRAVPHRSGLVGDALWNNSPESRAMATAPWKVVAWVAAVRLPSTSPIPYPSE